MWQKLEAGEVTDTIIRERLLNLSTHGKLESILLPDGSKKDLKYHLDSLVANYLGLDISASKHDADSWRLNFHQLDGLTSDKYPEQARAYALGDASFTLQVFEAQQARVETEDRHASLSTDRFQTGAAVALAWMTHQGLKTDPERVQKVRAELEAAYHSRNFPLLVQEGIVTPELPARPHARMEGKALGMMGFAGKMTAEEADAVWAGPLMTPELRRSLEDRGIKFKEAEPSHRSDAKLRARVEEVSKQFGIPVRLTEGGQTQCSDAVLTELAPLDPTLAQYQQRAELSKLVTTELPGMLWEDQPADVVHANFNVLVETGRTSSYGSGKGRKPLYPCRNGQNVDPRIRPCFVPRKGRKLFSIDFSTLELVTLAQTCYNLFGRSMHRDRLLKGQDLHTYLGSKLALDLNPDFQRLAHEMGVATDGDRLYELLVEFKKSEAEEDRAFFKLWRKFAKPVGLGYPGGLGAFKFLTLAKGTYEVDLIEEAMKLPVPQEPDGSVRFYAKKLFGMDEDSILWNPVLRGIALASRQKGIWLGAYPEMPAYFEHVTNLKDERNPTIGIRDDEEPIEGLCYTSPMGMHRAGATFTAVANGLGLQTPAAEAGKIAFFRIVRDSRVGRWKDVVWPILWIHDEVVGEVREDSIDVLKEVVQTMEDSLRMICPDVPCKAQPCIMDRWYKEAEPVYQNGHLVPWEPKKK
jgi:hypothetical protein